MVDVEGEKRKAATPFFIRVRIDSWEYFQSRASVINIIGHGPQRKTTPLIVVVHSSCAQKKPAFVPAKTSHSIGAIYAVSQETRRPEIQGQGEIWHRGHAGRYFGRCRLRHIAVGRSKKGGRGSDEATDPDVMDRLCIPWPGPGS